MKCIIKKTSKTEITGKALFAEHISNISQAVIENNWNKILSRRPHLFNSTLLRVQLPLDIYANEIIIPVIADITYKDVVGLRYKEGIDPRIIPESDIFHALSCYIFLKTKDGKLLFIERNDGDWNYALDFPGGFVQERMNIENIADFAKQRACDDLGIELHKVHDAKFLGTFDAGTIPRVHDCI